MTHQNIEVSRGRGSGEGEDALLGPQDRFHFCNPPVSDTDSTTARMGLEPRNRGTKNQEREAERDQGKTKTKRPREREEPRPWRETEAQEWVGTGSWGQRFRK